MNFEKSTTGVCMPSSILKRNSTTMQKLANVSALQNFTRHNLSLKWPISQGITFPVKNFTGREKELENLDLFLNTGQNLVLVCGFGGIGKTELCRKFIQNNKTFVSEIPPKNTSRVWLHGDSFESFKSSVFSFACELGVENDKASPSQMFEYLVKMTLRHSERLLVVINKFDTKLNEISKVIKMVRVYENIFILVTSRNSMILGKAGENILLDVLSQAEAQNIFRKCVNNLPDSDTESLCKLVQNYPLALQQAVTFIKAQREHFLTPSYSVRDYVQEFEAKKWQMLDQRLNEFEHDYAMTTLDTWDVTFNELSEDAMEFLKILAFTDKGIIGLDLFEGICVEFGYKDNFENAINILKKYSLIKVHELVIIIHKLVQDVVRQRVGDGFSKKVFHIVGTVYFKRHFHKLIDNGWPHLKKISQLIHNLEIDYSNPNGFKNPYEFLNSLKSQIAYKLYIKNEHKPSIDLCNEVLSSKYNAAHAIALKTLFRIYKTNSTSLVIQSLENLIESKKSSVDDDETTIMIKIVLAVILKSSQESERSLNLFRQAKSYYNRHSQLDSFYKELFVPIITNGWMTNDYILQNDGSFNYRNLWLEDLKTLLLIYKNVLGDNDELTLKVKIAMEYKCYKNHDYAKCLEILDQLNSSNIQSKVDYAYDRMFDIGIKFYTFYAKPTNYNGARELCERVFKFHETRYNEYVASDLKIRLADALVELCCELNYAMSLYSEAISQYEKKLGKHHDLVNEIKSKIKKLSKHSTANMPSHWIGI